MGDVLLKNGRQHANAITDGQSPWPMNRRRYRFRLRVQLPNHSKALELGVEKIIEVAAASGCDESARTDLEIVAREALANAMLHGNHASADKRVHLRCYGAPGVGLLVIISDEGAGFDPFAVPDPRDGNRRELSHGRGLLLMRELLDHVEYRKGGREVVLYKSV